MAMHDLRQGLINLFAIGLYHRFEHQMFFLYRSGLEWGYGGPLNLNKVQKKLLDDCHVNVEDFASWPEIQILKLVANCAKHSEGTEQEACAKLRAQKPSFFQRERFGVRHTTVYSKTSQPLAGNGLYLTLGEFGRLVASVKHFWTELGEAIRRV